VTPRLTGRGGKRKAACNQTEESTMKKTFTILHTNDMHAAFISKRFLTPFLFFSR